MLYVINSIIKSRMRSSEQGKLYLNLEGILDTNENMWKGTNFSWGKELEHHFPVCDFGTIRKSMSSKDCV